MFSKYIMILGWAVAVILTLLSCFGVYVDPIALGGAWAAVATIIAFYEWKAKNENRAKYAQSFLVNFADKYGAEIAARLAEIVLKD